MKSALDWDKKINLIRMKYDISLKKGFFVSKTFRKAKMNQPKDYFFYYAMILHLHSSWHKQFFTYLIATWAITSCYHFVYFKMNIQVLRDCAVIKALPALYWDYKNCKCFPHVSWTAVGSLWPITGPSSTQFTVYGVFFTVQWRLL